MISLKKREIIYKVLKVPGGYIYMEIYTSLYACREIPIPPLTLILYIYIYIIIILFLQCSCACGRIYIRYFLPAILNCYLCTLYKELLVMTINQRSKGQVGERELCMLLSKGLGADFPGVGSGVGESSVGLVRNIDQVRDGGADIMQLVPFAIEVKRGEQLLINKWLVQAARQVTAVNYIPVLAYRQNRRKWVFMLPFVAVAKKRFTGKKMKKIVRKNEGFWISVDLNGFLAIVKCWG